jgi:hypothetical protein
MIRRALGGEETSPEFRFDSSEVAMRLLKHHPDEADVDEPGGDEPAVAERRDEAPAEESAAPARSSPTGHRWGRRTVTVPVTVPERSVRRTMTVPSRSLERTSAWPSVSLGAVLAIAIGAALAVVGAVALVRTGIDASWFRPRVEVLDADHTALLGAVEIGAGLLLLLAGLTGNRVPVAILGLALALGATAVAIEPAELQRELAIERWWAWTLAAAGVVLTLGALQAPREHRKTVVDVS